MKIFATTACLFLLSAPLTGHADSDPVLTVTGVGSVKVRANRANISTAIELQASSAEEVSQQLADHQVMLLRALRAENVEELVAGHMNIYPRYSNGKDRSVIGYQGSLHVSFSSSVDKAGGLIDLAMQSGANKLHNVNVIVDSHTKSSARKQALQEATSEALDEAKIVLEALKLHQDSIVKIEIVPSGGGQPVYRAAYKSLSYESADSYATPEITDREEEIQATVILHVSYSL